jgi:hypothetical protein
MDIPKRLFQTLVYPNVFFSFTPECMAPVFLYLTYGTNPLIIPSLITPHYPNLLIISVRALYFRTLAKSDKGGLTEL